MTMPRPASRTRHRAAVAVCWLASLAAAAPSVASAQPPGPGPGTDAQADSTEHFRRARAHYQAGNYKEAIAELEQAVTLDPNAKVLVYNLGVVHEKRGDIDDALKYFRRYASMDLTPEEQRKNEIDVRRLEGAKKELDAKRAAEESRPPQQVVVVQDPRPVPPSNGRIDVLTISVGAVAIVGLGVGTVLGLKANADKPPAGFVTGRDGSYADLQGKASSAHREAVIADVALGVGIAAAVSSVLLYALRPREAKLKAAPPPPVSGKTSVSALPLFGGGAAVVLRGSF